MPCRVMVQVSDPVSLSTQVTDASIQPETRPIRPCHRPWMSRPAPLSCPAHLRGPGVVARRDVAVTARPAPGTYTGCISRRGILRAMIAAVRQETPDPAGLDIAIVTAKPGRWGSSGHSRSRGLKSALLVDGHGRSVASRSQGHGRHGRNPPLDPHAHSCPRSREQIAQGRGDRTAR